MYAFISGTIEEKKENYVVINNNGIGYEIFASRFAIESIGAVQSFATIPTYLYVKEDAMQLYGFMGKAEKDMFLELITVSGIGVKTAMNILSGIKYSDLIELILIEDTKTLGQIKGIGKKTAERIVLELKGSVGKFGSSVKPISGEFLNTNSNVDEAVLALSNMGLTKFDALKLVKDVAESGDSVEKIITKALKYMNK